MSIPRFNDIDVRSWQTGGPDGTLQDSVEADPPRSTGPVLEEGPRWQAPEGLLSVGDGWLGEGFFYQPCFKVLTPDVSTHSLSYVDYKLGVAIAKVDLTDFEAYTLIDCSPLATTIESQYQVAWHNNEPWRRYSSQSSPWGDLIDAGAPILRVHHEGSIVVLCLLGGNQVWAVDLDTETVLWRQDGWADYPEALVEAAVTGTPISDTDPDRSDLDYSDRTYTVLGPGQPGSIVVHVVERHLVPSITPDWRGQTGWSVGSEAYLGTLAGKWSFRTAASITITPNPVGEPAADLFDSGGFGSVLGSPNHSQLLAEDGTPRAGGHPTRLAAQTALDALVTDLETRLELSIYRGQFATSTSTRIEVRRLSDGVVLSTIEGEATVATGVRNLRGYGEVLQEVLSAADVDLWPIHPRDPSVYSGNTWVPDVPARRFYHPSDAPLEDRSGGVYGSSEPQFAHFITRLVSPALPPGWSERHVLRSMDSGQAPSGAGPTGLYCSSSFLGARVFEENYEGASEVDCEVTITRCYSTTHEPETIAPPWAFDPLQYCTDGRVAIFLPGDAGHQRLDLTREARQIPPEADSDLPTWEAEVARQHRIRCYSLGPSDEHPDDPAAWTLLWEINTLALCGVSVLYDGRAHPNCGDVLSNPVIYGGQLLSLAHGDDGQRLLRVNIYEGDDIAAGALTLNRVIGPSILRDGSYVSGNNGDTITTVGRLCYRRPDQWGDTLYVIGGEIYGCSADGRWWQLR